MGVSPDIPLSPPSYDQVPDHMMNLSMLYYSFFVVATAGVLLAVYHCLIVNWCAPSTWRMSGEPVNNVAVTLQGSDIQKVMQMESTMVKYKKGQDGGAVAECVICLSEYEDGEDVRQLLRCSHSFHAPCIDMWLYSHLDCPLCRTPVGDIKGIKQQSQNSTSDFYDPSNLV